jgi:type IX secretion system substrate protein
MKKYILCLTIVAIQQASVVSQGVNFYLTTDSVVYGGTAQQSFCATADVVNNGPDSVVVEAVRLINIVPAPPFWESALCVGGNCYSWIDTIWFTVHAGTAQQFRMYFRYYLHNTDTAHTYIQLKSITPGIVFEQYQNFYGMDSLILFTPVNEVESPDQLNICPIPANEFTVINWKLGAGDEIRIADALGKTLFTKKILSPASDFRLLTSTFQNGIYFLSVQTGREVVTKKIVVNH